MAARLPRCVVFAAVLLAGCAEPEVVHVAGESKSTHPPALPASPEQKEYRTLAAMIPVDSGEARGMNWWVFKLSGKADAVAKLEGDFRKLIDSVRVSSDEDKPISWELPKGWAEGDAGKMRHATLKAPEARGEVAVSRAGGILQTNVQRWWGQLWGKDKQEEITAAVLPNYARNVLVNGRLVVLVDMSGPKDPNASIPMMNPHGGQ